MDFLEWEKEEVLLAEERRYQLFSVQYSFSLPSPSLMFFFYFKDFEYMHKPYHGQLTSTVKLEERNVFCSRYNVRILIDKYVSICEFIIMI